MAATRESRLAAKAGEFGVVLEKGDAGHRLVDATTGTFVAADWTVEDGYGLTLDQIEAALAVLAGTEV